MFPLYDSTAYPFTQIQRGKTLLLLGTAKDGPVNQPIAINTLSKGEKIFGREGSLYRALEQVLAVDNSLVVYLMRISGEHAKTSLYGYIREDTEQQYHEIINLRCVAGGEKYNEVRPTIVQLGGSATGEPLYEYLHITFPNDMGVEPLMYRLDDYDNINSLVRAINEDTREGKNILHANAKQEYLGLSVDILTYANQDRNLEGGEDGIDISKDELYLALEYSYQLLSGFYIDYIIPVDAKFDDVHPAYFYGKAIYRKSVYQANRDYLTLQDTENNNELVSFQKQLIDFCKQQMQFGFMTHGIMGLNIIEDPSDLQKHEYSYIVKLLKTAGFEERYGLAEFANGEWLDSGYYVSIVSGEGVFKRNTDEEYYDNLAVTYAATLASRPIIQDLSNCPLPTVEDLRYEFTSDELIELSRMGIVAPRRSVRHGIVVSTGVTAAREQNDMHSIANVRQVQLTLSVLNEAIEEYAGEPIYMLISNGTLQKVIGKVLKELKDNGVLLDYRYNMIYDENKGTGEVQLYLMTKYMIDYIAASSKFSFVGPQEG